MTYDETLVIMGVLKTAYPSYYKDLRKPEAEKTVALWAEMFADNPVGVVAAAVKVFIANDTKGFPPAIGQIKNWIVRISEGETMSEMDAWLLVAKAISNSGYSAKEEFDKLPPVLQRMVRNPSVLHDWSQLDADEIHTVIQSNFMRSYRASEKDAREYLAIPGSVKTAIDTLSGRLALPEGI